ncbi:MAG: ribokinase [Pseudomonadota bacterium]
MILVIGNVVVDISYDVPSLPRSGETLVASSVVTDVGGKGFNQAVVCHRSGSSVRLVAAVGNDPEGQLIKDNVSDCGLTLPDLAQQEGATDRSIIYVSDTGENCIVSTTDMTRSLAIDDAEPLLKALTPDDTLLLQGNLTETMTETVLRQACSQGARTIVNPAPITFDYQRLWPLIKVAVVNEIEGEILTKASDADGVAKRLLDFGVELVLVTLGRDGVFLCDANDGRQLKAPAVQAVDSTGAGDVFCGVVAAAFDQRMNAETACRWAVSAASLSVTRRGTLRAFPSNSELSDLRPI